MILVTGATGFVGTRVIRELLVLRLPIAVVVRASADEAAARLARAWWDCPDLATLVGTVIHPCSGDITAPELGLSDDDRALLRDTTHVVHAAADIRLQAPLEELRRANRDGTARVLELAHSFPALRRILHVSTAYVAGNRPGPVREDDLGADFGFRNGYELSKFEGERLARNAMGHLPVTVARPGMVVGDSTTGAIKTFNTFYVPLRLCLQGNLRVVPVHPSLRLPLVPVDYVARSIAALLTDPRAVGATVHLVPPPGCCPQVGDLIGSVRTWADRHLGVHLPKPLYLPIPVPHRMRTFRPADQPKGWLRAMLPYAAGVLLERDTADRLLGPYDLDWRRLLPPLLSYAVSCGFLHRSERTVHEQVAFRLSRTSRPIRYHDIVDGTLKSRTPGSVRDDIQAARRSLHALGIRKGDRVAMVGPNCSRYLIIDVAVGLAGAVSVPLYPTAPPAELCHLIAASGARLAFIAGVVAREMGHVGVPMISFGRDSLKDTGVMTWEAFLRAGEGVSSPSPPVRPDDPASLRHTSGTTGGPRAVLFDHRNLRWMAECLASLLPWQSRIEPARHLSWLPMSHVVEGILATYAPYYLPAPVDIYFLEDFHQLPQALRVARPTAFFSVPRFYEKLWAVLASRPAGRVFLAHRTGAVASILRPLVRQGLLRAAGLRRCAYLIVGSAPSSPDLLKHFRDLGIEIHNAYGLTEAPLITLNRTDANRIGTVGHPLPETEVTIEEGEVVVRGPQVARSTAQTDPAGWLRTGDLGHLTPDGALVLEGRRRDIVATSYGKKIAVGSLEATLRAIPGVEEAMIVGECRPCCVALLWAGEDPSAAICDGIDRGVCELNARLLPPERIRRWAVMEGTLSPAAGELTANLKLKRDFVAHLYAEVVEGLYGEGGTMPGVRRVGNSIPPEGCA